MTFQMVGNCQKSLLELKLVAYIILEVSEIMHSQL